MNKAIEILQDGLDIKKRYLPLLIDRRDIEKRCSEIEDRATYYTPLYHATRIQVENLERDIAECEQALNMLRHPGDTFTREEQAWMMGWYFLMRKHSDYRTSKEENQLIDKITLYRSEDIKRRRNRDADRS